MASLFERLDEKRAQPNEDPDIVRKGPQLLIPPAHSRALPSEKLLEWLVNHWTKSTITLRDISAYGPNCARDPTIRTNLTQTLTQYGWLIPVSAHRRDMKKWRVVREPSKDEPAQI